jgi:hypothetical protein
VNATIYVEHALKIYKIPLNKVDVNLLTQEKLSTDNVDEFNNKICSLINSSFEDIFPQKNKKLTFNEFYKNIGVLVESIY